MRTILALVAFVAVAATASAQTASYQDEEFEYGQKQFMVNQKSENFQRAKVSYFDLEKNLQTKANTFNAKVNKLQDEREQWLARHQIYDNVISLRSKDKVMAALDEARRKVGVSELEGYQRMGIHNPYSSESYVKYFDSKTGELVIGEVRALYKNLDQVRQDFQQSCDRLRTDEVQISQDYQKVLDDYKVARDAKQAKDQAIEDAAKAAEALNRARAEAEAAEMERQRLEQQNSRRRPPGVID
jgi:hypothetical protein